MITEEKLCQNLSKCDLGQDVKEWNLIGLEDLMLNYLNFTIEQMQYVKQKVTENDELVIEKFNQEFDGYQFIFVKKEQLANFTLLVQFIIKQFKQKNNEEEKEIQISRKIMKNSEAGNKEILHQENKLNRNLIHNVIEQQKQNSVIIQQDTQTCQSQIFQISQDQKSVIIPYDTQKCQSNIFEISKDQNSEQMPQNSVTIQEQTKSYQIQQESKSIQSQMYLKQKLIFKSVNNMFVMDSYEISISELIKQRPFYIGRKSIQNHSQINHVFLIGKKNFQSSKKVEQDMLINISQNKLQLEYIEDQNIIHIKSLKQNQNFIKEIDIQQANRVKIYFDIEYSIYCRLNNNKQFLNYMPFKLMSKNQYLMLKDYRNISFDKNKFYQLQIVNLSPQIIAVDDQENAHFQVLYTESSEYIEIFELFPQDFSFWRYYSINEIFHLHFKQACIIRYMNDLQFSINFSE